MFSTITMALSTSIPNARMSEKSTTMFIEIPRSHRTTKDRNMDVGMEIATKIEVRRPSTKSRIPTISTSPEMMLFCRLLTMSPMSADMSEVIDTTVDAGKRGRMASISTCTASAVAMMFSPDRLTTSSVTTGSSSRRA